MTVSFSTRRKQYSARGGLLPAVLAASVCLSTSAQTLVPADRVPAIERLLNLPAGAPSFPCEIVPRNPERNFSLGFDVPYLVRLPSGGFPGPQESLKVFLRLAPSGGHNHTTYLENQSNLSLAPQTAGSTELAGRFPLEAGIHRISAVAVDQSGRICRNDWRVDIPAVPLPKDAAQIQPIGLANGQRTSPTFLQDRVDRVLALSASRAVMFGNQIARGRLRSELSRRRGQGELADGFHEFHPHPTSLSSRADTGLAGLRRPDHPAESVEW